MCSLNRLVWRTLFWGHATGNSFGLEGTIKYVFKVTFYGYAGCLRPRRPAIYLDAVSVTINDGALGAIEMPACRWPTW
jgi:hypothetical protein